MPLPYKAAKYSPFLEGIDIYAFAFFGGKTESCAADLCDAEHTYTGMHTRTAQHAQHAKLGRGAGVSHPSAMLILGRALVLGLGAQQATLPLISPSVSRAAIVLPASS